jgi:hypothetical protein
MAFFLRPFFLRLLLLCVMLNLGDAPYVDELMSEVSEELVVTTQLMGEASPSTSSKEQTAQPHAKRSIYENLLALVAMPMQEQPAMGFDAPSQDLPMAVRPLWQSAPPSSIDKPPRFAATA